MLDIDAVTLIPYHHPSSIRAASAPPVYRPHDDLDFYKGIDLANAVWHGCDFLFTFRGEVSRVRLTLEHRSRRRSLEHRSQDWAHVDDDRFDTWIPQWRTLRQVPTRSYSGAGMQV